MKTKLSLRLLTLCMGVLFFNSALVAQVQYCNNILKSGGDKEISLSCYKVTDGQYEIKIESEEDMNGLGGTFVHINENEPFELRGTAELSDDKKTIIVPIASTTAPRPYTPLYVLIDGEQNFAWEWDIDWDSDCGVPPGGDTEAPTDFAVTLGVTTYNSIELLLNATDNSGVIVYEIEFNSQTLTTRGTSGEEKSYFVTGLSSETTYTFSVTAKDLSDNVAANSPIEISGTTTASNLVGCEGTSKDASEGEFSLGYNYALYTDGSEVTVEFEMLDSVDGLVAFAHTYNPDFEEVQMENVGGRKFKKTYSGQALGATFTVMCKFAYEGGGVAITKAFEIIVGEGCDATGMEMLQVEKASFYPNPVVDALNINSEKEIAQVTVTNLLGQTIIKQSMNNGQTSIDMSACVPGNYLVTILFADGENLTGKVIK